MSTLIQKNAPIVQITSGGVSATVPKQTTTVQIRPDTNVVEITAAEHQVSAQQVPNDETEVTIEASAGQHAVEIRPLDYSPRVVTEETLVGLSTEQPQVDLSTEERLIKLQLEQSFTPGTVPNIIELANCLASDNVGNAVYCTSDKTGSYYNVTTVDITDRSKMEALGVIIEKTSITTCKIQMFGLIQSVFTGLTPGAQMVIGLNGVLTHPSQLPDEFVTPYWFQAMGQAISSTDVVLHINPVPCWLPY